MFVKQRKFSLLATGIVILAVTMSFYFVHHFPTNVRAQSQARVQSHSPTSCSTCAADDSRVIYAPAIDIPGAAGSDIVLNCRSVHEMHAVPTFNTTDGQAVIGNEIVLQPSEIRFVSVKSLIPPDQRNRSWGGMSISYTGKLRELWAQITTRGKGRHGSSDITFNVIDGKGAGTQDAVWDMPSQGKSVIALGNSAGSPIHVTAEFPDMRVEKDIPAYGTEYIHRNSNGSDGDSAATDDILHKAKSSNADFVHLTTSGPAGSLKAVGYVTENNSSYASMVRFYETSTVVQPNLYATDLKVEGATTKMLLRNTTQSPVTATIKFYPLEGSGDPFEMGSVALRGSETKKIDISALRSATDRREDLGHVNVRVLNDGPNGSLIGALYSVDQTTGLVSDVPIRDSGQYSNSTGAYPWRLDDDYKTKVVLNNVGDEPTEFTGAIAFNGGEYYFKKQEIKAGESIVFDIQKIRDLHIKDFKGNVIPANARIGQFRWSLANAKPGGSHLVGRSEVTSPSGRVSVSYSCPENCPWSGLWFDGWPTLYSSSVGVMTPYGVEPYMLDYYYNRYPQNLSSVTLSSADSGIGAVAASYNSADLDLTGVSAGSTTWGAEYFLSEWEEVPDYGCLPRFYDYVNTSGPVEISPRAGITAIKAVGKDNTALVHVEVENPTAVNITLTLNPKSSATGAAVFTGTGGTNSNTRTITTTTDVEITGVTESSTVRSMRMEATYTDGNSNVISLATMDFTVVKVNLTLKYNLTDNVTADNAGLSTYQGFMGRTTLGGPLLSPGTGAASLWRQGIEIKGTILPGNFDEYVTLSREIVESRTYNDQTILSRIVNCPDTTTDLSLIDIDPQSNGSAGKVYDLDAPGIQFRNVSSTPLGTILRRRTNWRQWASVFQMNGNQAESVRISADITWYERLSIKKTASGTDVSTDISSGDNILSSGATNLTWDFSSASGTLPTPGSCPP